MHGIREDASGIGEDIMSDMVIVAPTVSFACLLLYYVLERVLCPSLVPDTKIWTSCSWDQGIHAVVGASHISHTWSY